MLALPPPSRRQAEQLAGLNAADAVAAQVLSLLLRVADVFHPMRPFHLHKRWAMSIAHEFALQGKVEEQLGQATSPLTNTDTYVSSLGGSTIGFMDFLVIPLVKRLEQALPPFPKKYICTLELNKLKWRTYDNMVCSRRSSLETPATFSAKTPSSRAGGSLDLSATVKPGDAGGQDPRASVDALPSTDEVPEDVDILDLLVKRASSDPKQAERVRSYGIPDRDRITKTNPSTIPSSWSIYHTF
jgi:hypothetical protein